MSFNAIDYVGPNGARSRQRELLKEAERLHQAAHAVRAMKLSSRRRGAPEYRSASDERATSGPVTTGRAATGPTTASPAAMPRRKPSDRGNTPSSQRRPAWRTAAGKMGSSLVNVGKRLEHVGRRERE